MRSATYSIDPRQAGITRFERAGAWRGRRDLTARRRLLVCPASSRGTGSPVLGEIAWNFSCNPSDAEDLVADAVVKALDNLHTLRDRSCFRGWMLRILYNTFHSNCRSRAAHPEDCFSTLSGDEQDGEPFWLFDRLHQPFLLWWGNPEQDFVDRLMAEDVVKAIEALPESYRMVVVLADVEGFSYQEIAQALQIELGTVRSRLSRGRSLLQKALWCYAQEAGLVSGAPRP